MTNDTRTNSTRVVSELAEFVECRGILEQTYVDIPEFLVQTMSQWCQDLDNIYV